MTLNVTPEDAEQWAGYPLERCCMCRTPTRYWHRSDVALCPECAKTTARSVLPTKRQWWEKEKSLEKGGAAA